MKIGEEIEKIRPEVKPREKGITKQAIKIGERLRSSFDSKKDQD